MATVVFNQRCSISTRMGNGFTISVGAFSVDKEM